MQLTDLGNLFLAMATASALVSMGALILGTRAGKAGEPTVNFGYIATFATFVFVTLGSGLLVSAFLGSNYAFEYVALNHSTDVSAWALVYKFSGLWAGREGSLLFWEWMLSMFVAWVAWRRLSITDALSNVALVIANFVQLFFLVALFIPTNNPFKVTPLEYFSDGKLDPTLGMNPLLQTWAMVIHPPTLFIGYAGLTIPFAFAIAALILNKPDSGWVKIVDRITVFSWLLLGVGIGLGAIWAYQELAFGGYWAWDPVENASLLPWLTGVGLLHSFTVYRQREGFKVWSIVMATVTFVLVLLGTFITRSGIVQSVHAFEKDPLSFWLFLSMMVLSLAAGLGGVLWRRESFRSHTDFDSLLSKDASYYFNNVLMLVAGVLVAYWTIAPALPGWLPGGGQTYNPGSYNAVARPVGILYVFIMAVCPILSWAKTDPKTFWNRVKWPLVGAAALGAVLMAEWWVNLRPYLMKDAGGGAGQVMAIVGLLVASLAIVLPIYLFVDGARKRSSGGTENFGSALLKIFSKARTRSGGYVTHLGIGVILVGLIGSTMFVSSYPVDIAQKAGASAKAGPYVFTFQKLVEETRPNKDLVRKVTFVVTENGKQIAVISPTQVLPYSVLLGLNGDKQWDKGRREVDIIGSPFLDVFSIFGGTQDPANPASPVALEVKVNPLIVWVWIGFLLTILGTTLAAWPKAERQLAAAKRAPAKR